MIQKLGDRAFSLISILAVLFSASAIAQYYFTRGVLIRALTSQLDTWGRELRQELVVSNQWELRGFRQAFPAAPDYYVVAEDGLILDVQGFVPDLLPKVTIPSWQVYDEPITIQSSAGESWTLFGKRLRDGILLLGIEAANTSDASALLKKESRQFGSSVEEARQVRRRSVDSNIDYVVIDSAGELKQAVGGVPLTTSLSAVSATLNSGPVIELRDEPYFLFPLRVSNDASQGMGTIVVFRNIAVEQRLLRLALGFNAGIAFLCWLVTAALFAIHSYRLRSIRLSCEEAYAQEECQTVEFKSSLRWDYQQHKASKEIEAAVVKTVAAFLNTDGGTLLIGVDDTKSVLGLEADYQTLTKKPNRDGWELAIQQLLTNAIGVQLFTRNVRVGFCRFDGKDVANLTVRPAPKPVLVQEAAQGGRTDMLYVRVGNATKALSVKEALAHANERWG